MASCCERIAFVIDAAAKVFFRISGFIVRVAPLGAFGAMAFTIGQYRLGSLLNLGALILTFYATSALFVVLVLGAIARFSGFSILRFIGYIKDELLIVLGTSSSETVLPHMIQKMERLGASRGVVGLVIPTGYSFNLDGANIYMTLATLFLAQATNTPLSFTQELTILAIAMLTSRKGHRASPAPASSRWRPRSPSSPTSRSRLSPSWSASTPAALARRRQTARAELYRRLDRDGAPVSWGLRMFNGADEQQVTVLLPNPFLSADGDKVLKVPDWSRLELWDELRARWTGADRPDPIDRSAARFRH